MKSIALLILVSIFGLDADVSNAQTNKETYVPGEVIVKFTREAHSKPEFKIAIAGDIVATGLRSFDRASTDMGATNITPLIPFTVRELVLKAASEVGEERRQAFLEDRYGLHRTYTMLVKGDVSRAVALYAADPSVEYVGFNHIVTADNTPNDPMYPGDLGQWHYPKIQAPAAWDISTGSTNRKMGFIDSGVDLLHPDLVGNLYQGYDFVRRDTNALKAAGYTLFAGEDYTVADDNPMDFDGHGTHIAGIIGAVTNNAIGVAGTMWSCKLVPLRAGCAVIPPGGIKSNVIFAEADIAFAIYWSAGWGVDVINMSFSGPNPLPAVEDAINNGHDVWGMVFVASAGNSGVEEATYPAAYSDVIAVGGSMRDDTKDPYSTYGAVLAVAAPTAVLSTWYDVFDANWNGLIHDYQFIRGTSQSAALTSGLAGLVLAVRPDWARSNPEQVRGALTNNADKVGGYNYNWDPNHPGHSRELGYGRINAFRTLTWAQGQLRQEKLQIAFHFAEEAATTYISSHPNPFNPTTEIQFSVSEEGSVRLAVFDILGRNVATLVEENRKSGWYRVPFDGSRLSSGVYLVRLNVSGKVLSHRILLQK